MLRITTFWDNIPIQPTEEEIPTPVVVSSSLPTRQYLTRTRTNEIELSKKDNELIKKDLALVKEELETYKRPGTYLLKMAFKYLVPRRKILPFTHLLTNDESLQELEGVKKLARKKQAKRKLKSAQRKQATAKKQAKCELESAQKKQRKVEAACKKK
ncbi:36518_t:CDS:2, partial [Gigaspora margarita]